MPMPWGVQTELVAVSGPNQHDLATMFNDVATVT